VTCQANKKTSIEIDSVRKKLKEINAVSLLGDYTLVPDDITEELRRFGEPGVPLVLVYPKDPSKPPVKLPSLLTPSIVLNALDQATK
jgi:thiol:disulfide interchange protein DsbD